MEAAAILRLLLSGTKPGRRGLFLMELSLFSKKTVETPYATFHEESELYEA